MAISVIEQPNKFNFAKQTIPFLVKSSLIGSGGTIDPIETSFRFVFDILVQYGTGQYKTYASLAIPPRPDNFYAFLDVAPLMIDALTFDLGTHQQTSATACKNSIVKFRVFCTERYLDTSGNFISTGKLSIGEYYAIDGGSNEGITPYLIDGTTTDKKPLHHHHLITDGELVVCENEPLTLSWLSKNDLGVNELEYIHGNYGTFADIPTVGVASTGNVLNVYSGITKNNLTSLAPDASTSYGGFNSLLAKMGGITSGGNTSIMKFKFTNLDLSPQTQYQFRIWVRKATGSPALPASLAYSLRAQCVGTNFIGGIAQSVIVPTLNANYPPTGQPWWPITIQFTTSNLYVNGDFDIELQYVSGAGVSPLSSMNGVILNWDTATLTQVYNTTNYVHDIQIITDDGTINTLPTGYTANIFPLNDTWQSRFDTPVGPYKQYMPGAQDLITGFWLNNNTGGNPANWFQVRLRNNIGTEIGLSEKIYQYECKCDRYDKFRLKWKNSLGGWDYFTFTKVSKAKTSIERENFKRSRGLISSTSYKELSTDRGYKNLNIKVQDTYTVISDWVGDGTAKWLLDLFTSDEVYILNPEPFQRYVTTQEYDLEYPVFVQQNEVEYMNNSGEAKLKNYVIDITPAIAFNENTTN